VITRASINRLEVTTFFHPIKTRPSLLVHQEELLAWIALAAPRAELALLSRVVKQPRWKTEAELKLLLEQGLISQDAHGFVAPQVEIEPRWSTEQWQAAHWAIAHAQLPEAEGRLLHLIAGADEQNDQHRNEIADETIALAQRWLREGEAGKAEQVVHDGTQALRKMPGSDKQLEALLEQWAEVALFQGTPPAFDRVIYEICRCPPTTNLSEVESLMRAALAVGTWSTQALRLINTVNPFKNQALERWRQGVRVLSARRCSLAQEEEMLAEVKQWAETSPHPEAKVSYASWLGRLRYRQGRFEEAAAIQQGVVQESPSTFGRLSAWLNGASALLEAFRFEEASAWAQSALQLARGCRHSYFEGRAEWILRAADYRRGVPLTLDKELLEAAAALPLPEVEGLIALTEAAISWRAGDLVSAREISGRIRIALSAKREPFIVLLVGALELACGGSQSPDESTALIQAAVQTAPSAVALQVLGLLALGGITIDERQAHLLAATIPQHEWNIRREVLSIEEALLAINRVGTYR
jgi:eukaryotic-like serine/threonine-protein kinase